MKVLIKYIKEDNFQASKKGYWALGIVLQTVRDKRISVNRVKRVVSQIVISILFISLIIGIRTPNAYIFEIIGKKNSEKSKTIINVQKLRHLTNSYFLDPKL